MQVDELDEVQAQANVTSMPTFHVYESSKKIDAVSGAIETELIAMVSRAERRRAIAACVV